jgi:hypothetical protein
MGLAMEPTLPEIVCLSTAFTSGTGRRIYFWDVMPRSLKLWKMKATCPSEMVVGVYLRIRCHMPQVTIVRNHRRENGKSIHLLVCRLFQAEKIFVFD